MRKKKQMVMVMGGGERVNIQVEAGPFVLAFLTFLRMYLFVNNVLLVEYILSIATS